MAEKTDSMLAVVRIRGTIKMSGENKDNLRMMRLSVANHCTLLPNNRESKGMLKKAVSFVTWGEISPKMLEKLVEKRGRLAGDKKLDSKLVKETCQKISKDGNLKNIDIKRIFRLSPPRKGLKSIRRHFPKGDLGYRGDKINELLERMI